MKILRNAAILIALVNVAGCADMVCRTYRDSEGEFTVCRPKSDADIRLEEELKKRQQIRLDPKP